MYCVSWIKLYYLYFELEIIAAHCYLMMHITYLILTLLPNTLNVSKQTIKKTQFALCELIHLSIKAELVYRRLNKYLNPSLSLWKLILFLLLTFQCNYESVIILHSSKAKTGKHHKENMYLSLKSEVWLEASVQLWAWQAK